MPSKTLKQIEWVKLVKYCELTGETRDSVMKKRSSGMFLDGVHCKIAPDGNIWVNLAEVEKWVEQGNQATQTAITKKSQKLRVA